MRGLTRRLTVLGMAACLLLSTWADLKAGKDPTISPTPTTVGASGTPSGTTGSVSTSIGPVTIGVNFTGSSIGQSGFIPPDTMGAVGPNHVVELINGRFAVYQKDGTFLSGASLDTFWTNAGANPAGSFAFDPRIIYDPYSQRWFATSVDNASNANNLLVGVSASDDPTGAWAGFLVDSDTDNVEWADFPMLGVTGDRVTITANMFPVSSGSSNISVLSIPKADLLAGTPTVTNATLFENISPGSTGYTLQPVFNLDNQAGEQLLLSSFNKPSGTLKTSSLTGPPGSPTLSTSGGFISVTARNSPPDIDQPGPKMDIDASDNRFSGNVVQQHITGRANASLFGVHGVNIDGRAAIEWYEIDAVTNALLQSGTIADDSLAYNYPSIAVNDHGDVVIGFSGGDPNTFISTYAAVGQFDGGATSFTDPILLRAGEDTYERLGSGTRNRWGDYSATVLDPSDPNGRTFWTFQQFVNVDGTAGTSDNVWSVQITQITVVPEPGTIYLAVAALALIAIAAYRRRDTFSR